MCLQLQSTLNQYIDINSPILFNKYILNLDKSIIYNDGYFYFNCDGIYHINWWVTLNNPNSDCSFKIRSCKGHSIEGCTSNTSKQIFGDGLITVSDSHLKLSLVNNSNSKILLSQCNNIKASISIFRINTSSNPIITTSKYQSSIYFK